MFSSTSVLFINFSSFFITKSNVFSNMITISNVGTGIKAVKSKKNKIEHNIKHLEEKLLIQSSLLS